MLFEQMMRRVLETASTAGWDTFDVLHPATFETPDGARVTLKPNTQLALRIVDPRAAPATQTVEMRTPGGAQRVSLPNLSLIHAVARHTPGGGGVDQDALFRLLHAQNVSTSMAHVAAAERTAATEFESWARAEFSEAYAILNARKDIKRALIQYTGDRFRDVNHALRTNASHKMVQLLDEAATLFTNTRKLVVWRGAVFPTATMEPLVSKKTVVHKGYTSCSITRYQAYRFAVNRNHDNTNVLYEIAIPPGAHFIPLAMNLLSKGRGTEENEILLPRNSRFAIRSVQPLLMEKVVNEGSYLQVLHVRASLVL